MKFNISKAVLALALAGSIIVAGCSAAWVTSLDSILVAAAPALVNILNIIAIAEGRPLNATLAAKITADATTVKTLANDFAVASASAAPTACAQLQAAIGAYSADQASVLALAQVSDPAIQTKIVVLSSLVAGTVEAITAVIPNCQQAAAARASLSAKAVPLPMRSFVKSYNTNLVVPTGNKAVDAFTKKHKVHVHRKALRVLSLGRAS